MRISPYRNKVILFFSIFYFLAVPAFSQNPPGTEPGAETTRFEQETKREQEFSKKKPKPPEIELKEEEKKPQEPQAAFVLKEVKISGATIFRARDFQEFYTPYLNKEITFQDLDVVVANIKAKYKQRGYFTTIVYVPQQEIRDGVVEIRVVEGRMGGLTIEGNKWFKSFLLEDYFHTKKNEILNFKLLQRDILRLNQNSDLEVKTIISAGLVPGTSDITLKVQDKFPWHLGFGSDNQGSRLVGKWRGSNYIRSSNLSGNLDSFFLNSLFSYNSFGESLSYAVPLDTYGKKLSLDFTYFKMKLGKEYKALDIRGTSKIFTPHFLIELILREDLQLNADVGIEGKSIKKKMGGVVTSKDELRLPYFGFDFVKSDNLGGAGQTKFSPKFTFSTAHFLGASSKGHASASRDGTGGFFFKYEQGLSRLQRMPLDSYFTLKTNFQASTETLPSSEQFQVGGASSVRGYPEGDYLCDIGGVLNLEWTFPLYFIPKSWKLPHANTNLRHQIEPVVFLDLGGGTLQKVMPGEERNKFLMGLGGGLRVSFNRYLYLKLDWAKHIGDDPTAGSGPSTFHLTFQSEI